jgi:hypothetical protein
MEPELVLAQDGGIDAPDFADAPTPEKPEELAEIGRAVAQRTRREIHRFEMLPMAFS